MILDPESYCSKNLSRIQKKEGEGREEIIYLDVKNIQSSNKKNILGRILNLMLLCLSQSLMIRETVRPDVGSWLSLLCLTQHSYPSLWRIWHWPLLDTGYRTTWCDWAGSSYVPTYMFEERLCLCAPACTALKSCVTFPQATIHPLFLAWKRAIVLVYAKIYGLSPVNLFLFCITSI